MDVQPGTSLPVATVPSPVVGPKQDAISVAVRTAQARQDPVSAPAAEPLRAISQTRESTRQELEDATQRVEKFIEPLASQLEFSVDKDSGSRVVKVVDKETKEVIRQIPSEEMLRIASALDSLQGLLIRQKV